MYEDALYDCTNKFRRHHLKSQPRRMRGYVVAIMSLKTYTRNYK